MQSEYEGINKLRRGALLLIVVPILIEVIGFILAIILLSSVASVSTSTTVITPTSTVTTPITTLTTSLSSVIDILVALVIVELIGAILGIIGLINIRNGFGTLRNLGRDVGIGYAGATLYFIALGLVVLGILLIIIGGWALVIIGAIIGIVADILIGIGFYKVGEIYNEGLTKFGGILVAIPIGIISFIGYILVYVGLGNIRPLTTLTSPAQPIYPQMPPPTQPAQIYQIGQGIIRGDGYALISLYSSSQATALSARIEGTTLTSVNINPIVLQPGTNEISIKFDNVSSLTAGSTYLINLSVNIGGNIIEIKTIAVYQP